MRRRREGVGARGREKLEIGELTNVEGARGEGVE
jgi:hypothetical protein